MKVTHRELDLENGVIRFVIEVGLDEAHLLINKEEEARKNADVDDNRTSDDS